MNARAAQERQAKTYTMRYGCSNCHNTFSVTFERGITARYGGIECPKCGTHHTHKIGPAL